MRKENAIATIIILCMILFAGCGDIESPIQGDEEMSTQKETVSSSKTSTRQGRANTFFCGFLDKLEDES